MQQLSVRSIGAHRAATIGGRPTTVRARAQQTTNDAKQQTPATSTSDEIYIGFPKGDYAPRTGRKGRVIKDDPRKYPSKEDIDLGSLGSLTGVAGGWAGGEAGLWQLREAVLEEERLVAEKNAYAQPAQAPASGVPLPGKDAIYVGFGKDELDVKRTGVPGRVIYDSAEKYPAKEDVGFFAGAAGGFAGGERGVQAFVRDGEVRLRQPGEPGGQSISPLEATLLLLLGAGIAAGVVSQFWDADAGFQADRMEAAIESAAATEVLGINVVNLGLGAVGVLAVVGIARALLSSVGAQLRENATKLGVYAAFAAALYVAVRGVLEF